jgi:hypothetical protein
MASPPTSAAAAPTTPPGMHQQRGGWNAAQSLACGLLDVVGIAANASGPTVFVEGTDHARYHRIPTSTYLKDGGQLQFGAAASGL